MVNKNNKNLSLSSPYNILKTTLVKLKFFTLFYLELLYIILSFQIRNFYF